VPTRSQAALVNWQNVQISRRCSPRRGYRSARYRDIANNRDFTIPPHISHLSEYVDYNKDIILFGHAPEPIKEDKNWRLVCRNTNGIKPYGGSADLTSVMERLKLLQTGTVAFQETNLEWHNKGYQDEFQKLLVKAFGAARVDYSITKDKFETSPFKPRGTASAALGKMVHRVVKTGRDDTGCGRWSYITFNGKENKHITVINTYRVCSQRDPSDTTASRQQQCVQYTDEELRPYVLDPHKQTLIDLQYFVQEILQGGDEVILFLDAQPYRPQDHDACFKTKGRFQVNGSIDGSLRSFMANCGLTNALTDIHSEQVPNTHVRGSKQIDFALVTDGIRPCIKAVGILDESILKSDHREIFLDLDLSLLFGTSLERLERPQFRKLKLDDPRISYSYRKLLHKQFECHNIYDRVQKISERGKADDWSNEDERCYEVLDRDITAAMLRAAEKCTIRKQHDTPWAPSLKQGYS
jgi:hypothetical protein